MNTTQKNAEAAELSEVQNPNCKQAWSKPEVNNLSKIVETELAAGHSVDGASSAS